jgi:hypothetical protein
MEYVELDPIIETFIKDHFSHYIIDQIKKSFTLFYNYGIEDYEDYYLGLLPLQGIKDPEETVADVLAELNNELDYILLVHGIELIDQVNIRIKNNILEGMLLYIDALNEVKEIYYATLSDDELTPEEKLAYVLENFTDASAYEYMPLLQRVDPSLIEKMLHLIRDDDDILTSNPESILAYKQFNDFLKSSKDYPHFTIATSIVLSGFPLGLPINDYLPFIINGLLSLDKNNVLINLYSIYVLSSNFLENDFVSVYTQFENFYKENHREYMPMSDDFLKISNDFDSYRSNLYV